MFILTSIFGYIMSILLLLFGIPFILLQNLFSNKQLFDPLVKIICKLITLGFGMRVRTTGAQGLAKDKNYIFISNHVNIFDPILTFGFIPHFVRGVELESHFKWPIWGAVIRGLGNIPISHRNTKSAVESLEKAGQVIRSGTSIVMFPEGHRTKDGRVHPFMRGPFSLARAAEVDIIPIALKGLWERKTVHSFFVRPGKVEMIFGEPITAEVIKDSSDRELREKSREQIIELLS